MRSGATSAAAYCGNLAHWNENKRVPMKPSSGEIILTVFSLQAKVMVLKASV